MTDFEGIDEIVENANAVQLVFHVRRDWLADADAAYDEVRRKADACRRFLVSPAFKERFGMKPGSLMMKASRQPPADVMEEMARLGADVMVGNLPFLGETAAPTANCMICGRAGFQPNLMSMTDHGLTCPTCFNAWSMRANSTSFGSSYGLSSWQWARIVIAVSVLFIGFMLRVCT